MGRLHKSVGYALGALLAAFVCGGWSVLWGNDAAAEVAVGGIQLRKESRISMEKERLTISLEKVTVECEFLNTTEQDITTEVAFPTPPYEYDPGGMSWYGVFKLSDFRVWVDGREVKYEVDARAKLKGVDYTNHLRGLGIDILTFGHLDPVKLPAPDKDEKDSQIAKLPKSTREDLVRLGLLALGDESPTWTVYRTYHWTQRFPAHKVLRVRHEYSPVIGFEPVKIQEIQRRFTDACISSGLQQTLNALAAQKLEEAKKAVYSSYPEIHASWVKYTLTTANTWKTPIKDFELIVEEQRPDLTTRPLGIGMCWSGKVERLDAARVVAGKVNFIPTRELAVYYFSDYIEFKGKPVSK